MCFNKDPVDISPGGASVEINKKVLEDLRDFGSMPLAVPPIGSTLGWPGDDPCDPCADDLVVISIAIFHGKLLDQKLFFLGFA